MHSALPPAVLIVAPRISYLSRSLPRLFSKAGARVIFASPAECSVRSSRYIDELGIFDTAGPDAVPKLEEELGRIRPSLLVIVEENFVQRILDLPETAAPRARALLHLHPSLASRSSFHLWAESRDLRVPRGFLCHDVHEAISAFEALGPVFLKRDGSSGGSGVRKASTPEEVRAAWQEVGDPAGMIVQQALNGRVGVTDMIAKHGRPLAWVSSEKWRTSLHNGPSVARRLCLPEGMAELVSSVARETGFHGLGGFDWVIDHQDGLPRLIEFHPRPPSGFGLGRSAGVAYDLAAAALLGLRDETLQDPDPAAFRSKSVCCYFPDHLIASLRQREWSELRRWLPGTDSRSWSLLPWDDPGLLLRFLSRVPRLSR